jgi:putative ABC transport system ATP-binding protein
MLRHPRLILADEPTGNLDADNGRIVLECLRDLAKQGAAVMLVTHDDRAAAYAHRIVRMHAGTIPAE